MTIIKFALLWFGSAFSPRLISVLPSALGRAWRSVLPSDKHVQHDASEMILINTLHIKAFNLKEEN